MHLLCLQNLLDASNAAVTPMAVWPTRFDCCICSRMSRLLETWCLMEYAEKGSLADALRTGRLKRPNGSPELGVIVACLQDIASGEGFPAQRIWTGV